MIDFITEANKLIKRNLNGLSSFTRVVIYDALEYIDYEKGTALLPSLHEFAINDFYVERAPGRKREEVNENTIRNALRTIKKFKGDFFKFTTVNQRIEIEMPAIRELYNSFVASNEDAGVEKDYQNTTETLVNIEENEHLAIELSDDKKKEDVRATVPYKEYINKHNTNKQKTDGKKLPIADDFYPSVDTIKAAQELGFLKATDKKEIARFIKYNQDNETRWEDFNEPFMGWLNRCYTHKPKQVKQTTWTTRNIQNEQNNTHNSKFESKAGMVNRVITAFGAKIEAYNSGRTHHGHAC